MEHNVVIQLIAIIPDETFSNLNCQNLDTKIIINNVTTTKTYKKLVVFVQN